MATVNGARALGRNTGVIAPGKDADLILVMDDGAVAAQGTHEELMKTCEIYREVYESQQEGVSIGG